MIKALKGQTTLEEVLRITHQESLARISDLSGPIRAATRSGMADAPTPFDRSGSEMTASRPRPSERSTLLRHEANRGRRLIGLPSTR